MALQGYQSNVGQAGQAKQLSDTGLLAQNESSNNLVDRLKSFSDYQDKMKVQETQENAINQAYKDSTIGKPFSEKVNNVYGSVYNKVRTATYAADAELQLSDTSRELLIKYPNDPEAYNTEMKSFVDGLSGAAPTEELKSVIAIGGSKVRTVSYGKLKFLEAENIRKSEITTFSRSIDLNINQIVELNATGDKTRAEFETQKNLEYIGAMYNEGKISASEVQNIVKDSQFKITYGSDLRKIETLLKEPTLDSAIAFLREATTENREDMDVVENKTYRDGLGKLVADAMKAETAGRKTSEKWAKNVIKNAKKTRVNMQTPTNLPEIEAAKKFLTPEELNDYTIEEKAMEIIGSFGDLSLSQMRAKFEEYKKTTVSSIEDVAVQNKLDKILTERKARADDDVVGLALQESVIQLDNSMGVEGGVDNLVAGIKQMEIETDRIQAEYGSQYTDLLSKADAKEWSDWFDNDEIKIADKLYMLTTIAKASPDNASNIFRQIGGKRAGMFTFAATLSIGGNTNAAGIALKGAKSAAVLDSDFKTTLSPLIGNAFAGYPDELVFNNMMIGIQNYAKGTITQTADNKVFGSSVVSPSDAVKNSIGEIVDYNGQNTVLPYGVDKSTFEKKLDNISLPGKPNLEDGLKNMTDSFGSGQYQLRYAEPGKYYVRVAGDNPGIVKNEDGSKFILEWGKF